jgi:hypothetical protein
MFNGKTVTIAIPVLNNYIGLKEEIESIKAGSVLPDRICILDNGRKFPQDDFRGEPIDLVTPDRQISLSAAWNYFIDNIPEIRIIINDDLIFNSDTLQKFLEGMNPEALSFPYGIPRLNAFSFFSIPDSIVRIVGKFDEEFYPAYFEDNSYDYRMNLLGFYVYGVSECSVIHKGSQTLGNYTTEQMRDHHKQFEENRKLYIRMWGGLPGHETFTRRYNGN